MNSLEVIREKESNSIDCWFRSGNKRKCNKKIWVNKNKKTFVRTHISFIQD